MPVFVKGYQRGKSFVKSYSRAQRRRVAINASSNWEADIKAVRDVQSSLKNLKVKYNAGFRRLKRQGYDFKGFVRRTTRRISKR